MPGLGPGILFDGQKKDRRVKPGDDGMEEPLSGYAEFSASRLSGRICPPSTMMVCPVT
jgi:hypothetical protein